MEIVSSAPSTSSSLRAPEQVLAVIALVVASLSLLLSVISFAVSATDSDIRSVEDRLACLELPGSNPCGALAGR
jgi:hypothetical protein